MRMINRFLLTKTFDCLKTWKVKTDWNTCRVEMATGILRVRNRWSRLGPNDAMGRRRSGLGRRETATLRWNRVLLESSKFRLDRRDISELRRVADRPPDIRIADQDRNGVGRTPRGDPPPSEVDNPPFLSKLEISDSEKFRNFTIFLQASTNESR